VRFTSLRLSYRWEFQPEAVIFAVTLVTCFSDENRVRAYLRDCLEIGFCVDGEFDCLLFWNLVAEHGPTVDEERLARRRCVGFVALDSVTF
jgi:hypothetical protein